MTTAYSEFAIQGFELNVVDYLLKPFSFERFLSAINKVTSSNKNSNKKETNNNIKSTDKHIFFKQKNSHIQVGLNSILFIEASGNYTKVFTTDETITIREKVSDTIELLSDNDFIQVHKSFAFAKKRINRIEGDRIYIKSYIVPIGKLYKANLNKILK